jgi:hypothetical protein
MKGGDLLAAQVGSAPEADKLSVHSRSLNFNAEHLRRNRGNAGTQRNSVAQPDAGLLGSSDGHVLHSDCGAAKGGACENIIHCPLVILIRQLKSIHACILP